MPWLVACAAARPNVVEPGAAPGLELWNDTAGETVCAVRAAPAGGDPEAPDLLLPDQVLPPGGRARFSELAGAVDLRIEDCNGDRLLEHRGLEVPAGGVLVVLRTRRPGLRPPPPVE
ncbi:MAG: hypothetical protein AAGH15_12650 [Myxococcota bacterium]